MYLLSPCLIFLCIILPASIGLYFLPQRPLQRTDLMILDSLYLQAQGVSPPAPTVWPMASDRWCEDLKAQPAVLAQLRPTCEVQFITKTLLWDLAETGTIYLKLYSHLTSTLSQSLSPSTLKHFSQKHFINKLLVYKSSPQTCIWET